MSEHHDVHAILAWIPPRDRDRITAILHEQVGEHEGWVLTALAQACRAAGARP
jgi:hypothetical protein